MKIHLQQLLAFADEIEKIAAVQLMKPLSPAAKNFMNRVTGFAEHTPVLHPALSQSQREVRHALGGLHGLTDADMAVKANRQAAQTRLGQVNQFLHQTGRSAPAAPGLEEALRTIPGHPPAPTRTGAAVVDPRGATVASSPRARAAATAGTVPGRPSVMGKMAALNLDNPLVRTALAGMATGGAIGAYQGATQPVQQDQYGNLYQPTITDRFASGAKGLYRGGMIGGLLGLGVGAATGR